ncbi:TIGR01777 family protein [Solirubrobacter sp. CPCC 204708]|uniref:TIGR01777 family oxidoreductase n=1 Tax=Solirubrobacter deserti TaxID=2282478 RepID=A0ABT4RSE8_9ACTN|nr:TIGR01777 family oxidoreductase [Solirubrobacter deserti]MBE2316315.1 TIGR01777 family protein [Solirubrobacter deserti]MDA0141522.1 TIGR01777 family oxidoreductase [Solirubrobacter deserti]
MRVTITGASGLIGSKLAEALKQRGDEVIPVSLRTPGPIELGDVVVHLAGENVAQRWTDEARQRIEQSRVEGTRRVVTAINEAGPKPRALISSSAVGYYGKHGDERLDESQPPGDDFLAKVCVAWEHEAQQADTRVVRVRTGVVLDQSAGALAKMITPFKLGVGGPVASGKQYMPWIHLDDVVGIYLAAIDDERWTGPVNATAPEPVTNKEFSRALGRALHRPAIAPIPAFAIRTLYGDMAEIVTEGQRAVPRRTLELGYRFRYTDLDEALKKATSASA